MKNARSTEVKPSALDALLSIWIVLVNNLLTQQAIGLLALMLLTMRVVIL